MRNDSRHNKQLWFKAKWFGWGWYPASWQGWLVTLAYLLLILLFSATVDDTSPPQEVAFTFFLPVTILTVLFIRIAYKTGEKPYWCWGPTNASPALLSILWIIMAVGVLCALLGAFRFISR